MQLKLIKHQILRSARRINIAIILLCAAIANAGTPIDTQLPEWLTLEEKNRIEKERDEKDRVEALMKIASARLAAAVNNVARQQYEQATDEIKNYGSLVNYTLTFIVNSNKKEKDKREIYRKFELNLRRDFNSLEALRYELPQRYADEANEVYEQARKARETALAAIFGKDFFKTKEPADKPNPSMNNSRED